MKKINKKDKIYLIILTVILISMVVYITKGKFLYGSITDWNSQHSIIPEYFRALFYRTFDLFPDFALNLGSGQNIYNYSYYGLLNPVIMISYLLPFIDMKIFISISSVLLVYASALLFYYFLRSNKFNEDASFLGTLSLMLSSPLLFHSHRHIMFMNYMPFLIMALIGVDKYFKSGNKKLLCISTVLMIFMSYYYSIPGIICNVVYGIYKYISLNKKITFKSFIKDGFKFIYPILIGILISSILLVPTFYVIVSGRMENVNHTEFLTLLTPKINIKYITYNAYGIGLTSLALIALIVLFFDKKRENKFLFYVLSALVIFPIINYILNAGMYIDSKSLIPFLPLFCLIISSLFDKVFNNAIDSKKLIISSLIVVAIVFFMNSHYYNNFYIDFIITVIVILLSLKFKFKKIFMIYVCLLTIVVSVSINNVDRLQRFKSYYNDTNKNQKELISNIKNEDKFNHITLYDNVLPNVNNVFGNIDMYQNYIYSSTNNAEYNVFYFDTFNNPMQSRNRLILSADGSLPYLMFTNNKYVVSDNFNGIGYEEVSKNGESKIYKNDSVLPFMYVSYNKFNVKNFNKYSFPYTQEILLNNVVVSEKTDSNYETNIKEFSIKQSDIKYIDTNIEMSGDVINVSENYSKMIIKLPSEAVNKIIFISLNIERPQSCSIGDMRININNATNVLTCEEWKYYNGNTEFTYTLSDKNTDKLELTFSKGKYNISNLKMYYLDYEDIKNVNKEVTSAVIDNDKTKGDKVVATVNALEDGYFVTTIPYDKGFTVKIDGKKQKYEKVNTAFVGFKISKGEHSIEIKYNSPYKTVGSVMSVVGIILYIVFVRRKK